MHFHVRRIRRRSAFSLACVRYAIPVRPQNLYFFSFVAYFRSGEKKLEPGGFIRNFNQSDQFTSTVGSQGDVAARPRN
jgi:hypothetical protein